MKKTKSFNYIIDQLDIKSPYGKDEIYNLRPYTKDEVEELEVNWKNIELLIREIERSKEAIERLEIELSRLKDIRGSVDKLKRGQVLNEIDCYEIKLFLLNIDKIFEIYNSLNIEIEDISFNKIEKGLDILDIDGERLSTFYISDRYSENLRDIRKEKLKLEKLIRTNIEERDNLLEKRSSYVKEEEKEERIVLEKISKELSEYLELFNKNFNSLKKLDFLLSKARISIKYKGVKPSISKGKIIIEDGVNPYIENIIKKDKREFTPISIELTLGTTIITGANMGGKTVALETIYLQVLLFIYGFYPFAKRMSMIFVDEAFLLKEDESSLESSLSSFAVDIDIFNKAIKDIDDKRYFIALDEFARGTNPDEGAKIVRGVSRYLNNKNSISLITTHYENIPSEDMKHYQIAGFKDIDFNNIKDLDDLYKKIDYRLNLVGLEEPIPKDALKICKLLGMKKEIVEDIEKLYLE